MLRSEIFTHFLCLRKLSILFDQIFNLASVDSSQGIRQILKMIKKLIFFYDLKKESTNPRRFGRACSGGSRVCTD